MEDVYDCFDKRVIIEFEYATQTNSALLWLYIHTYIIVVVVVVVSLFSSNVHSRITKYKLHDTCIYHLLWNSLGVSYPVKNGGMSLLKRRVGCWRNSATEDLPVNPALCSKKATLTNLPLAQMAAISQTTFSQAFSWMKIHESRWRVHWRSFLRFELNIFQHWFR